MSIGERIRDARLEAGLSQHQLALRVSATKRAIAFWEANERTPAFPSVVRIARATDKPLDFFGDAVPQPKGTR